MEAHSNVLWELARSYPLDGIVWNPYPATRFNENGKPTVSANFTTEIPTDILRCRALHSTLDRWIQSIPHTQFRVGSVEVIYVAIPTSGGEPRSVTKYQVLFHIVARPTGQPTPVRSLGGAPCIHQ